MGAVLPDPGWPDPPRSVFRHPAVIPVTNRRESFWIDRQVNPPPNLIDLDNTMWAALPANANANG